jgi:hypothetical protein
MTDRAAGRSWCPNATDNGRRRGGSAVELGPGRVSRDDDRAELRLLALRLDLDSN